MDIQKLLDSGYSLNDIKDLIGLFRSNLINYQHAFKEGNLQGALSTLHKLKGGLGLLYCTEVLESISYIEDDIKINGSHNYQDKLLALIKECDKLLTQGLSDIKHLSA